MMMATGGFALDNWIRTRGFWKATCLMQKPHRRNRNLRNNIGRQRVFEKGNAISQRQFPLFQPLQLQGVVRAHRHQRVDGGVEIAMFLPKTLDFTGEFRPLFFAQFSAHIKPLADLSRRPPRLDRDYVCPALGEQEQQCGIQVSGVNRLPLGDWRFVKSRLLFQKFPLAATRNRVTIPSSTRR